MSALHPSPETDYIGHARAIIAELREHGLQREADTLQLDMEAASVGSEMLMTLRFHMRQLLRDDRVRPETALRMGALIADIDRALA